jgi:hypothetical protein
MDTLETCTDLERRGELPPGEGVKPMNLVSEHHGSDDTRKQSDILDVDAA